ncbi:hypothetical protein GE061_013959 [Apolygus lucorum]|uniref:Uncharacterized protein n=1 Tax=Apolygus lucorum TaxID=248454 RepID=A0A8S9XRI0_APOLU|nr:hypothetical protein GE061_013959 [Apolygus lucorum]
MMSGLMPSKSSSNIGKRWMEAQAKGIQRSSSEVIMSRGFKPSDKANPQTSKFLTELSYKMWGRSLTTFKRARARSAGSPPEPGTSSQQSTLVAPPVPSVGFRQPAPEAPPARPPLSAHAPRRRATPSKPKDPHAQP